MRTVVRVALLVALWLLAWGDITIANLLSGAAIAVLLLVAFPAGRQRDMTVRFSAVGTSRLLVYVIHQLVVSNMMMTRQILRRRPESAQGILAHRLQESSDAVATVMTSIISLSPGTMTIDVLPDSSVIYVHFFDLSDIAAARAGLVRLERLVVGAISARPAPVVGDLKEDSP